MRVRDREGVRGSERVRTKMIDKYIEREEGGSRKKFNEDGDFKDQFRRG